MSNTPPEAGQHKNDMYGNIDARNEQEAGVEAPIPSATVVLLRDTADGPEVLMLKKNSKISFGGMWVFPGGKIDAEDHADAEDEDHAARIAVVRETEEETGLVVEPEAFTWFARWTPPPGPQKRFTTWFFAAHLQDADDVVIDDGEIKDHAWVKPEEALANHAKGEIDLVPPTWVTLYHLSRYAPTASILQNLASREPRIYQTRVVKNAEGVRVAMWFGDAGYDAWDAEVAGARHRLVMSSGGFTFENTAVDY